MGCDPECHRHRPGGTEGGRGHDVVFVGSHYPVREKLFAGLAGADFAIWGPGWERLPAASPLRMHVKGAHTTPAAWTGIYRASRIVLSVHYRDPRGRLPCPQAAPGFSRPWPAGLRPVRPPAGRARAVSRGRTPGLFRRRRRAGPRRSVTPGKPGRRERIARQGTEAVLRDHTYAGRIRELLETSDDAGRAGLRRCEAMKLIVTVDTGRTTSGITTG
jgi:hypothetical protein